MQEQEYRMLEQQSLFDTPVPKSLHNKFISIFRVSLVKDRRVSFESTHMNNSAQAQPILRKLIDTQGQQDRENFCVVLLSAKNEIIGLNIASIGGLSSAEIHPREVLKPAILANSAAMILCHNLCYALHKLCYVKLGFMWIDLDLESMEGCRSGDYGRAELLVALPYFT